MRVPLEAWAERRLHEIADAVVAAGRNPSLWREVPPLIAEAWPGTRVLLHGGPTDQADCLGLLQHGFEPDVMQRYEQYYFRLNPWNAEWRRHPVLHAVCSNDTLPWPSCAGTEFYDDFFAPQGDIECATGIKLFDEPDRSAFLGMHYGGGLAEHYDRLFSNLLQRLAPVMRAALSLNREIGRRDTAKAPIGAILEALSVPALIVDRHGAPWVANPEASAALDRGDCIHLDVSGRIRLRDNRASARLTRAIARVCGPDNRAAEDIVLRAESGRTAGLLCLYPVDSTAAANLAWLFEPRRLVLLILRRTGDRPRLPQSSLNRLFGLTPAEAGLASRLASGESLASAADALGMAKETARVHLRAVFTKTDTHRQAELVSLLATLARRH